MLRSMSLMSRIAPSVGKFPVPQIFEVEHEKSAVRSSSLPSLITPLTFSSTSFANPRIADPDHSSPARSYWSSALASSIDESPRTVALNETPPSITLNCPDELA